MRDLFIVCVEMSKRKTSTSCDVKKPLRKMRALSGYNLWHGEYLRSQGITHNWVWVCSAALIQNVSVLVLKIINVACIYTYIYA